MAKIIIYKAASYTLLLIASLSLISCNRTNKPDSLEERVEATDWRCREQINKAAMDVMYYHNLVYCQSWGIGPREIIWRERAFILKSHNIGYKIVPVSDVMPPPKKHEIENCYCEFMRERIEERFGSKFIDSLFHIADSIAAEQGELNPCQ